MLFYNGKGCKGMAIYKVDLKVRVVEASSPQGAAYKAGCMPFACTVTEITQDILNLQANGDLKILKGEETKG